MKVFLLIFLLLAVINFSQAQYLFSEHCNNCCKIDENDPNSCTKKFHGCKDDKCDQPESITITKSNCEDFVCNKEFLCKKIDNCQDDFICNKNLGECVQKCSIDSDCEGILDECTEFRCESCECAVRNVLNSPPIFCGESTCLFEEDKIFSQNNYCFNGECTSSVDIECIFPNEVPPCHEITCNNITGCDIIEVGCPVIVEECSSFEESHFKVTKECNSLEECENIDIESCNNAGLCEIDGCEETSDITAMCTISDLECNDGEECNVDANGECKFLCSEDEDCLNEYFKTDIICVEISFKCDIFQNSESKYCEIDNIGDIIEKTDCQDFIENSCNVVEKEEGELCDTKCEFDPFEDFPLSFIEFTCSSNTCIESISTNCNAHNTENLCLQNSCDVDKGCEIEEVECISDLLCEPSTGECKMPCENDGDCIETDDNPCIEDQGTCVSNFCNFENLSDDTVCSKFCFGLIHSQFLCNSGSCPFVNAIEENCNTEDNCVEDTCIPEEGCFSKCLPLEGCNSENCFCEIKEDCPPHESNPCFLPICSDDKKCDFNEITCLKVPNMVSECTPSGCLYSPIEELSCSEYDLKISEVALSEDTVRHLSGALFNNVDIPDLNSSIITSLENTVQIDLDGDVVNYIKYKSISLSVEIITIYPDARIGIEYSSKPSEPKKLIDSTECKNIVNELNTNYPDSEYICFVLSDSSRIGTKFETSSFTGGHISNFSLIHSNRPWAIDLYSFSITLPENGNTYLIGNMTAEICFSELSGCTKSYCYWKKPSNHLWCEKNRTPPELLSSFCGKSETELFRERGTKKVRIYLQNTYLTSLNNMNYANENYSQEHLLFMSEAIHVLQNNCDDSDYNDKFLYKKSLKLIAEISKFTNENLCCCKWELSTCGSYKVGDNKGHVSMDDYHTDLYELLKEEGYIFDEKTGELKERQTVNSSPSHIILIIGGVVLSILCIAGIIAFYIYRSKRRQTEYDLIDDEIMIE